MIISRVLSTISISKALEVALGKQPLDCMYSAKGSK